jgi:hypothetical protein
MIMIINKIKAIILNSFIILQFFINYAKLIIVVYPISILILSILIIRYNYIDHTIIVVQHIHHIDLIALYKALNEIIINDRTILIKHFDQYVYTVSYTPFIIKALFQSISFNNGHIGFMFHSEKISDIYNNYLQEVFLSNLHFITLILNLYLKNQLNEEFILLLIELNSNASLTKSLVYIYATYNRQFYDDFYIQ